MSNSKDSGVTFTTPSSACRRVPAMNTDTASLPAQRSRTSCASRAPLT